MSKIKAVVKAAVETMPQYTSFQPHPGHYHLVKLDANGDEIPGSDVSISPNTFNRSFKQLTEGEHPSYVVKKNHKS